MGQKREVPSDRASHLPGIVQNQGFAHKQVKTSRRRLSRVSIVSGGRSIRRNWLADAADTEIWEYAKPNGYAIVSKDSDFQARSLLYGHPPKFIWLRVGNCPVKTIEDLLRTQAVVIHTFGLDGRQEDNIRIG